MDKKYVVYQHVTPDEMYYFGVTQNVERRWSNNGAGYKGTALQPYIEKFGWENIKHIVLFRDKTKEDALWIEDFLITTAQEDGVCINKQRSGNIRKEDWYRHYHYQKNRDKILEQRQDYYQKNRDKELEQKREYYQKNRDKELERRQDYYQKNRDKILEQQREYYQRKKLEKQLK